MLMGDIIWVSKHTWENNIKINLKLRVCEDVGWNNQTQDRNQLLTLVDTSMNLLNP
jgi:hypothetical protein